MQRTVAVVAATVAILSGAARAQGGLGLKGGFSYGDVSNRGVLPGNLDTRTGFALGAAYTTGGFLGFGVEGLYAQRGVSSGTSGDSRRLDYIDVPAYVAVNLALPGLSPFGYAGPQLSFELHCGAGGGACPSGRPKTTTAAVIGGGARFGRARAISLEGRYVYGLTDLKLSTITASTSYKTRSFLILAGLRF